MAGRQRDLLGSEADPDSVLSQQLAYWAKTLDDLPAEVTFPLDRPRPAEPSHSGDLASDVIRYQAYVLPVKLLSEGPMAQHRRGRVDGELAAGLGGPAAAALAEAAVVLGRDYDFDRWLVNGRSRAPVAIVRETDLEAGRSRRIVLKVPTAEHPAPQWTEVQRHREAYAQAPPEFAAAHLARLTADPQRVGDGSWLVFQEIAGDDVDSVEVLTTLLNTMLDSPTQSRIDPGAFARTCGEVVGGILNGWTGPPRIAEQRFTVARFLRGHVLDQMEPGGRLHALSQRYPHDEINVPGEAEPLPNPFALARGAYFGDAALIPALVGRTHGDLHTDNVLVRVRPAVDGTDFHLIDLALYELDGPVTRDPAHLVLYILARRMDTISPAQQAMIIDALLDPDQGDRKLLPGWIADIIGEVDRVFRVWLKGTGLQPEWRQQRLLSLAGCALLFLGRKSTRPADHDWFLLLAARAACAFMSLVPPGPASGTPASATMAERAVSETLPWRSLSEPLPAVWLPDVGRVRIASSAVLEVHVVPVGDSGRLEARRLISLGDELAAFGRTAQLFTAEEDLATREPAVVASATGSGLAVTLSGQRSGWIPLPRDLVGAVLDPDDLASKLTTLLSVLASIATAGPPEVGFATGIITSITLAEGRVASLPRVAKRSRTSMSPIRVPAQDVLPFSRLAISPRDIGEELAARILLAFRSGTT
jgi:hypothetical protein